MSTRRVRCGGGTVPSGRPHRRRPPPPPSPPIPPVYLVPRVPPPPRRPQPIEPALIEPGTLDPGLAGRVRTWQVVLVGLGALTVIVTVTWLLIAYASDPILG